ncbi:MAG: hypothetical protein L3J10_06305 [Sulfurimonas sp.]|nr:hypothetical protein [Sulfurimonas sp.]
MNRKLFLEKLEKLDLNQKEFSLLIGYSYQAVKQWKDTTIPKWLPLIMDHLEILKNNASLAKEYGLK